LYIPAACLVLILPFLLVATYSLPHATLLLLGVEIVLQLGVHSWNLGYFLDRPLLGNFRSTDIALGERTPRNDTIRADVCLAVASATPTLVFLLVLTSHLLGDIRPHLPQALQGLVPTVLFAVFIAPLIPTAVAGSLLGGFAAVRIRALYLKNVVLTEQSKRGGSYSWISLI
jgi:hypothetical protein